MKDNDFIIDSKRIKQALKEARRKALGLFFLRAGLELPALAATICLLLIAVEKIIYLPAAWRIGVLFAGGSILAGVLCHRLWRMLRDYGSLLNVARAIDRRFPHFRNRLEAALEFCSTGGDKSRRERVYSAELMHAAVGQAASLVRTRAAVRALVSGVLEKTGKKLRVEGYLTALLTALFLVFCIADPSGSYRTYLHYRHPLELLGKERSFRIYVYPGNKTILRGETLKIRAAGSIYRPGEMLINLWQAGKGGRSHAMSLPADRFEYNYTLYNVENDIHYTIEQSGTVTDTFLIRVTNNPFVTELRIRYEYPGYTGLEPFETSRDKSIEALRGTRVVIAGRASNPLTEAELALEPDDSLLEMKIFAERSFSDTMMLEKDCGYRIRLKDVWGLTNTDTLVYPVTVIPDERPAIVLRFPAVEQSQLDESMKQPLVFEIADDYGVSRVRLVYRRERPRKLSQEGLEEQTRTIARYSQPSTYALEQYLWNLSGLSLMPGDVVAYHLVAVDNDMVSGPKTTATPEYRIRFPSMEEIFEQEQNEQEEIASDIEQLEEQGRKIREQVKQMSEAVERGEKMDWEEGRRLDGAMKQQMKMVEQVRELAEKLEQSISRTERGDMASDEMLEKMEKVHELMKQITRGKMKDVLDKIRQAMEKVDRKALAEAMDQLQLTQEDIMDKLDKTLALLERIKIEQQMDYLVQKSGDLCEAACRMSDSTAALAGEPRPESRQQEAEKSPGESQRGDSMKEPSGQDTTRAESADSSRKSMEERGAGEQESTGDDERKLTEEKDPETGVDDRADDSAPPHLESLDNLSDDLEKIEEQTMELFERMSETSQNLGQAGEKIIADKLGAEQSRENRDLLENLLTEISGQLSEGRLRKAMPAQRRAVESMEKIRQRMKELRDELEEKWKQEVAQAMESAFDDLAYLSGRQEEVLLAVGSEPDINHPDILEYAEQEQDIVEGLEAVSESLIDAARNNFFISNKLLAYLDAARMRAGSSLDELGAERRNKSRAEKQLRNSLGTINAGLITLLQDSRDMKNSESGIGMDQMLSQLEALAEQQENLNRMTQGAFSKFSQQSPDGNPMSNPMGAPGHLNSPGDLMRLMRQLAAEQQAIREQVAELARQMSGRKNMPGSILEGVMKDADQVVRDMIEKGVSPETFKRQRKILDRLLDSQRSMQKRDSGRRRKSERPGEYFVTPPEDLATELLERSEEENLLKDMLEHWKGAYPESFETLIRDYFELLRAKEIGH